ncbi:hypothetical protein cyc_04856 [Cyclospora cayetanensis]|uniref:Uncharacterized protein n=1 Tax=Cyclospora cayetanensis TaxID=88456 RepID=A0A1D3D0Y8_9EIME|nr:hypothetical protein cyc_04856 [Cyclospora cayetanensis]
MVGASTQISQSLKRKQATEATEHLWHPLQRLQDAEHTCICPTLELPSLPVFALTFSQYPYSLKDLFSRIMGKRAQPCENAQGASLTPGAPPVREGPSEGSLPALLPC